VNSLCSRGGCGYEKEEEYGVGNCGGVTAEVKAHNVEKAARSEVVSECIVIWSTLWVEHLASYKLSRAVLVYYKT